MGKKSKRGRKSQRDDHIVSDSDVSHHERPPAAAPSDDGATRPAPALRPGLGAVTETETPEHPHCEDPYEDLYEEEGDDDEYEDVYESSGDEDAEYLEAMVTGDDAGAARRRRRRRRRPRAAPRHRRG